MLMREQKPLPLVAPSCEMSRQLERKPQYPVIALTKLSLGPYRERLSLG